MRFTLNRTSSDGDLPLIDELPNYPVARLEGINGVGKSVTVRLLELCAGQRPDFSPDQWVGFCEALGTVEVEATVLAGCASIFWQVSGQRLLDSSADADPAVQAVLALRDPEQADTAAVARRQAGRQRRALPRVDWFDEILVDGLPIDSMDRVRDLLFVERIGGEAGFVQTIASYAEEQGESAAAALEQRLAFELADAAGRLLDDAEELLSTIDATSAVQREAAFKTAHAALEAARAEATVASARLSRLRRLSELQARITHRDATAPELDQRISQLDRSIEQLEKNQEEASKRIATLEASIAGAGDVQKDLRAAERTYKSQNTRMANLAKDLAKNRRLAGLEPEADPVPQCIALRDALREAERARDAADARPVVSALIDAVLPLVRQREDAGHGDLLLVALEEGNADGLSIGETAQGLAWRRESLLRPVSDSAVAVLNERVERAREALQACRQLPLLMRQFESAKEARSGAEQRQRDAAKRLAEPAAAELEKARAARRAVSDEIVTAAAQRALVLQQREELATAEQVAAARRELAAGLADMEIAADDVEPQFQLAAADVQSKQRAVEELAREATSAEAALARVTGEIDAALSSIRSGSLSWFSTAGISAPPEDASLAARVTFLERVAPAVAVVSRMLAVRQLAPQVRAAVQQVVADLLGQDDLGLRHARVDSARSSLERHTAAQFDVAEVRDPLLGKGATELRVNLLERTMEWRDESGRQHKRPLEGFSSGEQAFGFTQARLALASRVSRGAANQLIALDEFGAFVSGQRLRDMRAFLASWTQRRSGIQLILILPARDFDDLAARAAPRERPRYDSLAAKMRDPGYLVEPWAGA